MCRDFLGRFGLTEHLRGGERWQTRNWPAGERGIVWPFGIRGPPYLPSRLSHQVTLSGSHSVHGAHFVKGSVKQQLFKGANSVFCVKTAVKTHLYKQYHK